MATTTTRLADVIVPEIFKDYMIERTSEKSALFQAGIIAPMNDLVMGNGGSQVECPFWQDLTDADQLLDDGTDLTVGKITAAKDTAVLHARANVHGADDLAGALAGSNPMRAIADLTADKWNRDIQKLLIQTLNGSTGAVTDNVLDISALSGAASDFDGESFIDACAKLGDQSERLSGMAVHSATYHNMLKQDLIDFIPDSEGKARIATYQGKTLVVDDGMPVASGGVYTSYIFGQGAIGWGEATNVKEPVETEREALLGGGQEYLVTRRHFVLHPRGIAWTPASGVPAKTTPSNAEAAAAANWTQKYESQNIRIVKFVHTLA